MSKIICVSLLVFVSGCFWRKSPSQNYQVTSDGFTAVYLSLIDLSQAGYLSEDDLKEAIKIKNAAKPILNEYAEMVKKDPKNPSLEWVVDRLRIFIVDLAVLEAKGKKKKVTENQKALHSMFDVPDRVIPVDHNTKGM